NRAKSNPYISDLFELLQTRYPIDILYLTPSNLLARRVDLIHIQWPEYLVRGPSKVRNLYKRCIAMALLLRAKVTSIPVLQTVHNLEPHEQASRIERFLLRVIDRNVDFRILLNDSDENPIDKSIVALHPKYEKIIDQKRSNTPSHMILSFGAIRPYKGFERLIQAFQSIDACDIGLVIAGNPIRSFYGQEIAEMVREDDRISFIQRFLTEEEIQLKILRSEIVVLPYTTQYD